MPLPPQIDTRIRQRFQSLLLESDQLPKDMVREDSQKRARAAQQGARYMMEIELLEDSFSALKTKTLSLLQLLTSGGEHIRRLSEEVTALESKISHAKRLNGIIRGLKDDYESGLLEDLSRMIESNVAADYLGQAEQLLKEGQPGKYDHVPAAVLAGAILEDALRRLCQRQTPQIPLVTPNGQSKTMNPLIDDLKKANVFNELKAKQLRSWADIRNAAAHGEFQEFDRKDVEQMLVGVQNFLADYL